MVRTNSSASVSCWASRSLRTHSKASSVPACRGQALFVLPVGRDAVLGGVVHLPGTDLDLKGDALPADDRGVEALVAVGLGVPM